MREERTVSPLPPPKVSEDTLRSSSETTPRSRTPLNLDARLDVRRQAKPSLSGSSAGLGSESGHLGPSGSGNQTNIRSGSRADGAYPAREASASPAPSTSSRIPGISPQKIQRTLDSKLITRELDRLGLGMSQHPASSTSTLAAAASASTLSLVAPSVGMSEVRSSSTLGAGSSSLSFPALGQAQPDTPIRKLHIQVLPLFNGEPLRSAIEDLNELVRQHLQSVLSNSPSKAKTTLETDVKELVAMGMLNLDAKLTNIDDDKFLTRLVEVWNFFWLNLLPYLEGIFLPLQIDPLLSSLGKAPKDASTSSAALPPQHDKTAAPNPHRPAFQTRLDVHALVLECFRDALILPRVDKLQELLSFRGTGSNHVDEHGSYWQGGTGVDKSDSYQRPRLQQMLLVLHSNAAIRPSADPSPGEYATHHLLRLLRPPSLSSSSFSPYARASAPSYNRPENPPSSSSPNKVQHGPLRGGMASLAAGAPRDRRGRMIRLDTPGAEAWRAQAISRGADISPDLPISTHSDDKDEDSFISATFDESESGFDILHPGGGGVVVSSHSHVDLDAGADDADDSDASDESDFGVPIEGGSGVGGSRTPTIMSGDGYHPRTIPNWRHGDDASDDDDSDYGQPVVRGGANGSLTNRVQ